VIDSAKAAVAGLYVNPTVTIATCTAARRRLQAPLVTTQNADIRLAVSSITVVIKIAGNLVITGTVSAAQAAVLAALGYTNLSSIVLANTDLAGLSTTLLSGLTGVVWKVGSPKKIKDVKKVVVKGPGKGGKPGTGKGKKVPVVKKKKMSVDR